MSIKRLSYENLQDMVSEIDKKYARKSELGAVAALDKVGESHLSEALRAVIQGKADAASTLAGYGITDGMTASEIAAAISTAIAGADHLQRTVVSGVDAINLTAADAGRYIYLVSKAADGESDITDGNTYDEYMVINGVPERMGDWKVDLSDYAKTADMLQTIAGSLAVDVTGTGNVITGVRYNPETKRLCAEKSLTALTESDFVEYTADEINALFNN